MPPYLLVVESDPELQRRIGDTLREARYELAAETEAAWARRSLLVRPPEGVILDTYLTDGPGFSVAEALRADPDTARVPIFFVASRFRGASHRAEARRRFAPAEYLETPLDLDSLLALVLETVPPTDPASAPLIPDYPSGPIVADPAQQEERRAVERAARAVKGDAELRGSLARQPFARILQRIYARRMTGALLLSRNGTKKIVYFTDGYPISVRSNVLAECLGQILVAQRMITRDTLEESLRRMKVERKHQGAVLVEMGALSPWNLQRALVAQMEAKLYEIFAWRSGHFAFRKGKPTHDEPVRLERTPAALVLEGIRRYYGPERLRLVLAPYAGAPVAPSADPLRRLQDITSDPAELRFIDGIDGARKLEAVLAEASIPTDRARLLLVAMAEAGMIEPARVPRAAEPKPRPTTVELLLAERSNAAEKPREELEATLEAMTRQSHAEVLSLRPEATPGEVDSAYETLARDYHPDRFRFRSDDVRTMALKIFDRLGEAQAVMRDPARRRKYMAQLERERARPGAERAVLFATGGGKPSNAAERVYFSGVEHLRGRRYTLAVQAFRQAVALAPLDAGYRGALGWAIFREAPTDPAALEAGLAELKRGVEIDPQNPWVRISLGRFYAETGRADQAIAEFEVAQHLSPGLADVEEEIRRLRGQT